MPARLVWRLTALGFGAGALIHGTAWILTAFGNELYGPGYPWWHHAFHVVLDGSIAWAAIRRLRVLTALLLMYLLEQAMTVWPEAWHAWTVERRIFWVPAVIDSLTAIAAVLTWRPVKKP